jgi:hypothetical protein
MRAFSKKKLEADVSHPPPANDLSDDIIQQKIREAPTIRSHRH